MKNVLLIAVFILGALWFSTQLQPRRSALQFEFDKWLNKELAITELPAIVGQATESKVEAATSAPELSISAAVSLEGLEESWRYTLPKDPSLEDFEKAVRILRIFHVGNIFSISEETASSAPHATFEVQSETRKFSSTISLALLRSTPQFELALTLLREYSRSSPSQAAANLPLEERSKSADPAL